MKTDDIKAMMEALLTISHDLTPTVMAQRFYGRMHQPIGGTGYIEGKFHKFQEEGLVWAYNRLDLSNQRRFYELVKDVIDGGEVA